jgi:hypothetical protein
MSKALVVAQYLGLGAQRFGQFADLCFNPKYWATRQAAVDIASGKNALPTVQTEN